MSLRALFASVLFLTAGVAGGACSSDAGSDEFAHNSCEGAYKDDNGTCRIRGRFAKKVCCEAQSYPTARQNLDAYRCSGDDAVKVAFFDADSTLRISRGGTPTANAKDDVYVLPFVASKIKQLNADGYLVAIVSNQGGVAAGYTPIEVAEGGLLFVGQQLAELGAEIDYMDFAEAKNEFRKPKTGMAELLEELLQHKCGVGIDYENSFMVGDAGYKRDVDGAHPDGRPADDFSNSDRGFAEKLEIPFSEPTDYFGWRDYGAFNIRYKSTLVEVLGAIDAEADALEEEGDDEDRVAALREESRMNRLINDLNE